MRRSLSIIVLVLLAGCVGTNGVPTTGETTVPTTSETTVPTTTETPIGTSLTGDYIVSTAVVESAPEDANVTDHNSSRLRGDTVVKGLVEETYNEGGIWRDISEEEFDTIEAELADVPRYNDGEFGYYVEYRGTIIRLQTLVEE